MTNLNSRPAVYDRAGLYAVADAYLAALAAKDPSRLPLAPKVVFTENNVQLRLGDGLWNTVSTVRDSYDLKCADIREGQVCWFGIVEEWGHPAVMALRLKVDGELISEIETVVCRKVDFSPFPSIDTYVSPRPLMLADVPEAQRRERARLLSIADGYFDYRRVSFDTARKAVPIAEQIRRLLEEGWELSAEEIATRLGKNPASVRNVLVNLPGIAKVESSKRKFRDRLETPEEND